MAVVYNFVVRIAAAVSNSDIETLVTDPYS